MDVYWCRDQKAMYVYGGIMCKYIKTVLNLCIGYEIVKMCLAASKDNAARHFSVPKEYPILKFYILYKFWASCFTLCIDLLNPRIVFIF